MKAAPAWPTNQIQKSNLMTVELEWEEMIGATQYQIELEHIQKKSRQLFQSASPNFILKLEPGIYRMQGRVADERGVYGDRSKPEEFRVLPRPPKVSSIKNPPALQPNPKTFVAETPVRWEPIESCTKYKVSILDFKGTKIQELTTSNSELNLKLRAGTYKVLVQGLTADGLESLPSEIFENLQIQAMEVPAITNIRIEEDGRFRLQREDHLKVWGILESRKFLATQWKKIQDFTVADDFWMPPEDLAPGQYRISFFHQNIFNESSRAKTQEFEVKPTEKSLP